MPYVYSTATCSTAYVKYAPPASNESSNRSSDGFNRIVKKVIINGGNGVATKHLVTPIGSITFVSDEDLEFLLQDQNFQRHMKEGFITYDKKKVEPEKKAKNMKDKDGSFPLTPKNFEKSDSYGEDVRMYKGRVGLQPELQF